jgi:predicted Na+-dependent transporter
MPDQKTILLQTKLHRPRLPKDMVERSRLVELLNRHIDHPLILGLLVKSNSPDTAKNWAPVMNKIGSLGILILLVVGLGLNLSNVISLIGTGGFLALLLFIFGSLLIGFAVGGRDQGIRNVMGLGTAQRNVSAAILITLQNFAGTMAVPYVLVAAILLPLILLSTARWLGKRGETAAAPVTQSE